MQKWQTKDVGTVVSEKAKHVRVDIAGAAPMSLHFHAGSKDHAEAIIAKLELSKSLASPPASATAPRDSPPPTEVSKKASVHFSSAEPVIIPEPEDEEEEEEAEAEEEQHEEPAPRQVSYAPPPRAPPRPTPAPVAAPEPEEAGEEEALALYDFTADGEDELSVTEGERLVVLEKDGDEWWKCRNTSGGEGVVPASYLEVSLVLGGRASILMECRAFPEQRLPPQRSRPPPALRPVLLLLLPPPPHAPPRPVVHKRRPTRQRRQRQRQRQNAKGKRLKKQRQRRGSSARERQRLRRRRSSRRWRQKPSASRGSKRGPPAPLSRASFVFYLLNVLIYLSYRQQSSRSKDPRTSSAAGSTTSKTSSEVNRELVCSPYPI